MNTYQTDVKWSEDIKEKVLRYKYAKKIFLDSNTISANEQKTINKVQCILSQEIKDNEDFETLINNNTIFSFIPNVDFVVRSIEYEYEDKNRNLVILNSIIIFLIKTEENFEPFLDKYTDEVRVEGLIKTVKNLK